ncbi:MAG TPA: sigma-70 family RNA polymerase sigma factor, partial [Gemmataceae bacterium]|nr:sigma-70 family RNA polymerase sigma factor [Gemmataceae bacterium]
MTNEDPSPVTPSRFQDAPCGAGAGPSDQTLLKQYVDQRDDTAFAALVQRHGPLVLGVCLRVLGHRQDAEDAFQATFLVLARKARAIRKSDSMGGWLYRVAYRIASKLKGRQARRYRKEQQAREVPAAEKSPEWVWRDVRMLLDEEVNRLPHKYRLPFILCYLDGKTNEEAARQLACPVGTLTSWLARARERLRVRLTRRGVTLSAGLLVTSLTANAGPVTVPLPLAELTIQAGLRFTAGQAPGAMAARLAGEYFRSVLWRRVLMGAAGTLALGVGIALLLWLLPLLGLGRPDRGADHLTGSPAVSPQEDVKKFQGIWKIEALEFGGQKFNPQGTRMVFKDRTGR